VALQETNMPVVRRPFVLGAIGGLRASGIVAQRSDKEAERLRAAREICVDLFADVEAEILAGNYFCVGTDGRDVYEDAKRLGRPH
jgi:hypothetical protein